jgi:hypothetical protein
VKKILLGLVIFILAVVVKAPISYISPYIKSGPLNFEGTQGTLWKGKASQLRIEGIKLGAISWTINPIWLLTGKIKGDFFIKDVDLDIQGDFGSSLNGDTLTLDNTRFAANGRFINKVQHYAIMSGNLNGFIDHFELQQSTKLPPKVAGMINWERGGLLSPIKLPKGNYQLILKPEADGKMLGMISSNDAPVDIKGNIKLDSQWKYITDLKIKSTAKGKTIQGMLSMAGKPGKDGYIHVKQVGNLLGGNKK